MAPAHAQMPSIPGASGGAAGMLGGTPDLSSMSTGNAAGVLEYCLKNKLLGGTDATSVLGGLDKAARRQAIGRFRQVKLGTIATSGKSPLSLDSIPPKMKTKACNMVLKHAKSSSERRRWRQHATAPPLPTRVEFARLVRLRNIAGAAMYRPILCGRSPATLLRNRIVHVRVRQSFPLNPQPVPCFGGRRRQCLA